MSLFSFHAVVASIVASGAAVVMIRLAIRKGALLPPRTGEHCAACGRPLRRGRCDRCGA